MKLLFLDTETSGTDIKKHGIFQLSGMIEIDGRIIEEFDFNCRLFPHQIFDAGALAVTGKTVEEIRAYPEPIAIYSKILTLFNKYIDRYNKNDKFYLVGQNIKFDYDFMTEWFNNCGNRYFYAYIDYHLIDLMCLSTILNVAGIIKTKNMKLQTMADYFGIEFKAHNSFEDIRVTRSLFYKMIQLIKK